jgi:hypothetical protein
MSQEGVVPVSGLTLSVQSSFGGSPGPPEARMICVPKHQYEVCPAWQRQGHGITIIGTVTVGITIIGCHCHAGCQPSGENWTDRQTPMGP